MKTVISHVLAIVFSVVALTGCGSVQSAAQKEEKAREIAQKIDDFHFTFSAIYALPTGYRSIYLSPYYSLKVSPDTVEAYLPYYGRAYTAPMNPSDGGIKFTSTDFEYNVVAGRKVGNWTINIKPKDVSSDILLSLDIWENGTARLNASSSARQPISFQGDIE